MENDAEPSPARQFLRREPILDLELRTSGYLLQFHSCAADEPGADDARSAQRAMELLEGIEPDALVARTRGFYHLPLALLTGNVPLAWPPERLVPVLDGAGLGTDPAREAVSRLARAGYTLAARVGPELADIDLGGIPIAAVQTAAALTPEFHTRLRRVPHGPPQLWATDVTSHEQFDRLRALGTTLFQGRFWRSARIAPGRTIPSNRMGALELLAQLQDPDVNIRDVERIVSGDATLSYKLIKLLNSAYFSAPSQIDSIRQGVIYFGLQRIKNWATVIALNAVEFQPRETLALGANRAYLCELAAQALGRPQLERYYLAGLFSILDTLFDSALPELLEPLHLVAPLHAALLGREGAIGEVLNWVVAAEDGVWAPPADDQAAAVDFLGLQLDAASWCGELWRVIGS